MGTPTSASCSKRIMWSEKSEVSFRKRNRSLKRPSSAGICGSIPFSVTCRPVSAPQSPSSGGCAPQVPFRYCRAPAVRRDVPSPQGYARREVEAARTPCRARKFHPAANSRFRHDPCGLFGGSHQWAGVASAGLSRKLAQKISADRIFAPYSDLDLTAAARRQARQRIIY